MSFVAQLDLLVQQVGRLPVLDNSALMAPPTLQCSAVYFFHGSDATTIRRDVLHAAGGTL